MPASNIYGDTHFVDLLSMGSILLPANAVNDASVIAAAGIQAAKLQHQYSVIHTEIVTADTITTGTFLLHIARGVGQVIAVEVSSAVVPDADTSYFTVNIVRRRLAVAANVLSVVVTYNNTNALAGDGGDVNGNYAIITGTIDGANDDLADNDILEVVVTDVAGDGTTGSGLVVNVVIREAA